MIEPPFRLGVIEGFFGSSWSWEARLDFAPYLAENAYQAYLYGPKEDDYLRKLWYQDCPPLHLDRLRQLALKYHDHKLEFGVCLSPFEIHDNFKAEKRRQLERKVAEINSLNCDTLCILFDDMRGDFPGLAQTQCEIVHTVQACSKAKQLIMCPTYYSYDDKLPKFFGDMPTGYLEDLGRELSPAIDIFWTGPQVISASYPASHLREVTDKLQRRPLIWDNYPVNDSAQTSPFLHLRAFQERDKLQALCRGHFVNPMKQAYLSRIPLQSLPRLYREGEGYDPEQAFREACLNLCGATLGSLLIEDLKDFQDRGLETLTAEENAALRQRYAEFSGHPYGMEILDWLAGNYAFDPACLT